MSQSLNSNKDNIFYIIKRKKLEENYLILANTNFPKKKCEAFTKEALDFEDKFRPFISDNFRVVLRNQYQIALDYIINHGLPSAVR